jgi:hypothetical protein
MIVAQLVKKLPKFQDTRIFITVFGKIYKSAFLRVSAIQLTTLHYYLFNPF